MATSVVFIVENNGYAMGTSVARTASHQEIWKLGLGYEMPCEPVDGMDPVAVAKAVDKAVTMHAKAMAHLLEMKTYRYRGHSMSDAQHYRTKDEVEEYKKIDPITQVKEIILEKKYATAEALKKSTKALKYALQNVKSSLKKRPILKKCDVRRGVRTRRLSLYQA